MGFSNTIKVINVEVCVGPYVEGVWVLINKVLSIR